MGLSIVLICLPERVFPSPDPSAIDTGPGAARLEAPNQFEIPAPTAQESLVVIYATKSPGAACYIYLNDERIAALRPNSFTFAMLQSGRVILDTRMGNGKPIRVRNSCRFQSKPAAELCRTVAPQLLLQPIPINIFSNRFRITQPGMRRCFRSWFLLVTSKSSLSGCSTTVFSGGAPDG